MEEIYRDSTKSTRSEDRRINQAAVSNEDNPQPCGFRSCRTKEKPSAMRSRSEQSKASLKRNSQR